MKLGREIGLAPIKSEFKEGNEELKVLHYNINDILYRYSIKYIPQSLAPNLIAKLESNFYALEKMKSNKAKDIFNQLRFITKNLRNYYENYQVSDKDVEQALKTAKFQLSTYLKKNLNTTPSGQILQLLEQNRGVYQYYLKPLSIDYKPFSKMQSELLSELTKRYELK